MKRVLFCIGLLLLFSLSVTAFRAAPTPQSVEVKAQATSEAAEAEATAEPTPPPQKGGTLVVARPADANLWDPKYTNDNNSLWAQGQIFATLLQNSPDGQELRPWLAESWETNDDATEFTFKLRNNAKFCDDSPITAQDVKFSLERAMEEDSSVSWQYPSSPKVEAVDDATVKITLEKSNVAFPSYLTLWGTHIVSEAYATKVGNEKMAEEPLGSGPFCLAEWKKGELIVLKPNPGYWDAENVYVDEVQLKVVQDDTARVLQLQTGEVDIALDVPYSQLEVLAQFPGVKVHTVPLYGTAAIALNQKTVPEFADKKVRQAMNYAVDRQALVNAVLFGKGEVAKSPFYGPTILFWTGDFAIDYDLDKAKALMAESSAPDGLSADLIIPSGDTLAAQTAVILKDQLSKIGIELTITPVEAGTWWETWSGGEYQMLYKLGTNDVIDPAENIPFDFWSKEEGGSDAAFTFWHNDEVTRISKEAEATLDPEKRAELYYELQKIAMDEVPQMWLFHPSNRWATRDNIYGFAVFSTGLHRFWETWKIE